VLSPCLGLGWRILVFVAKRLVQALPDVGEVTDIRVVRMLG